MEKAYRLVYWLDLAQAIDYLESLTKCPTNERLLLQLCEAKQCNAYADVDGVSGHTWEGSDNTIARGIHLVTNPMDAFSSGWTPAILTTRGDVFNGNETEWAGELPPWKRGPIFQPSEIEALAERMVGTGDRPSQSELDELRKELEQERAARKAAEVSLADSQSKLRVDLEIFKTSEEQQEFLRQELKQERAAREAAEFQAMQADAYAASLRQELESDYYARKADEELKSTEAYHRSLEVTPYCQLADSPNELAFPYSTKHLKAMRDAAVEFWQGHDITKPAPYGIQKTVQNFLAARTGENARKLAELAAAIKPDGLPKS